MAKQKSALDDQHKPARDLIYSRPHRIVGEVHVAEPSEHPSPQYESPGERTCLLLLSCCHDVKEIASQPFREPFSDLNQKQRTHIPDFQVLVDGKTVVIEYKPLKVAVKDDITDRLISLGKHYSEKGQRFSILTSDQIDIQPRKRNASILRRFRFSPVSQQRELQLQDLLANGSRAISELAHDSVPETFRDVCALISRGILSFDWAEPLSYAAQVSIVNHPYKRLTYADIENSGRFCSLLQELAVGRRPSDQRLLAAARARDWTVCDPSAFGFLGSLPAGAFTGSFRTPGSLVGQAGHQDNPSDHRGVLSKSAIGPRGGN